MESVYISKFLNTFYIIYRVYTFFKTHLIIHWPHKEGNFSSYDDVQVYRQVCAIIYTTSPKYILIFGGLETIHSVELYLNKAQDLTTNLQHTFYVLSFVPNLIHYYIQDRSSNLVDNSEQTFQLLTQLPYIKNCTKMSTNYILYPGNKTGKN